MHLFSIYIITHILTRNTMDINFKRKIDELVNEVSNVTDLPTKIDILNYMEQQANYMLWMLEDEQRIDEDSRDY